MVCMVKTLLCVVKVGAHECVGVVKSALASVGLREWVGLVKSGGISSVCPPLTHHSPLTTPTTTMFLYVHCTIIFKAYSGLL